MSYYLLELPLTIQDCLTIYPSFIFFRNCFFSFCSNWMEQYRFIFSKFWQSEHLWKSIIQFIRSSASSKCNYFNNKGIKHLTRLRLGLYQIRDSKFKDGFHDSINPSCSCGLDIETTCLCLLRFPYFMNERTLLLNDVSRVTKDSLSSCESTFVKLLIYGDDSLPQQLTLSY